MKVINLSTETLIPYASNARTHGSEQIQQIANSIKEFGWTNPILIKPDKTVIAGHGRLLAAKQIGIETVPCIVLENLSDEQCRALVIADNKLAENSGWDFNLLASELQSLKDADFDLPVIGFSDKEIEALLSNLDPQESNEDSFDSDKAAEEIEKPITKLGNIWQLGNHRLMCGDSAILENFTKLLNGTKCDFVFTDPPYGVSIGDKNKFLNKNDGGKRNEKDILKDTLPPDKLFPLLTEIFKNVKSHLNDCASIYVTSPQNDGMMMMMMMMMMNAGLKVRHVLIWVKNNHVFSMGRLDYDYQHEPILFTWNKTHKKIMKGNHKTSCWFINKPQESKLHPTMKPIELVANALLNSSEANDAVLDPFGGSGTTLIACEQLNRKCYMMELDPLYCDVIVKRWETLTNKKAIKENGDKRKKTASAAAKKTRKPQRH